MSLLKAILDSNYTKAAKSINRGYKVNDTLNTKPPMSMLDIAIQTREASPSEKADSIIDLLKSKGGLTYAELLVTKARNNLPPLSVKGTIRGNIKKTGIAGLPRGGFRRSRRTRKNRN